MAISPGVSEAVERAWPAHFWIPELQENMLLFQVSQLGILPTAALERNTDINGSTLQLREQCQRDDLLGPGSEGKSQSLGPIIS